MENVINPLEFRKRLENETGLKVNMKIQSVSSSMRGYVSFSLRKTKDGYKDFDFQYCRNLNKEFPTDVDDQYPNYFSTSTISVYIGDTVYNYIKTK